MTKKETKQKFIFSLIQSLFIELSLHPKPGLVTPLSTNSHSDMDFYLMLDSTKILFEYFNKLYEFTENRFSKYIQQSFLYTPLQNKENNISLNIFLKNYIEKYYHQFIKIGKIYENKLLESTNGINTYKGILFSYSIFIIGFNIFNNLNKLNRLNRLNTLNSFNTINRTTKLQKNYFKNHKHINNQKFINNNFNLIFNNKIQNSKKLQIVLKITGKTIVELKTKYKDIENKSYGTNLRNKNIKGEIFTIAKSGYKICFDTYKLLKSNLNNAEILYKNKIISNQLYFTIKRMIYLKAFCYIGKWIKDSNIGGKKGIDFNNKFNQMCGDLLNYDSLFNFSSKNIIKSKKIIEKFLYTKKHYTKKHSFTITENINIINSINNEIQYFFKEIEKINLFMINEKLSPGGTADLLSFSIALYLIDFF